MNYRKIYKMAMDKLKLKENDRLASDLIKTSINEAYREMYEHMGEVFDMEVDEMENSTVYLAPNTNEVVSIFHSRLKTIPKEQYTVYYDKVLLSRDIGIRSGESIIVRYIENPTELSDDKDVPKIPTKYHIALMYYAMFVYNDNFQYLNRYNYYLRQLQEQFPRIDEGMVEEIVWDNGAINRDDDLSIIE